MSTARISSLLRQQYGAISRTQLAECGWSGEKIKRSIRSGEFVRFAGPSVLRSAAHDATPEMVVHGTSLWLGASAVLLGRAAAWWWGLLGTPPQVLDFSGPKRRGAVPLGAALHRVYVDPVDRARLRGICVLDREMAALRAAADLELDRVGSGVSFVDRAIQTGTDPARFRAVLERHRFCSGNAVGRYIADVTADDSESVGERRTAALMSGAGIRGWRQQVSVTAAGRRYRLDFAFESEKVAVEFDGFAFHHTPERFRLDRARDDDLKAAGWRVVHLTWGDIHASPDESIWRIKRALAG